MFSPIRNWVFIIIHFILFSCVIWKHPVAGVKGDWTPNKCKLKVRINWIAFPFNFFALIRSIIPPDIFSSLFHCWFVELIGIVCLCCRASQPIMLNVSVSICQNMQWSLSVMIELATKYISWLLASSAL